MKREDKYYTDWLLNKDSNLSKEDLVDLEVFVKGNPQQLIEWKAVDALMDSLKTPVLSFSDSFEQDVMRKWQGEKEQFYDHSSMMILYAGVAAAVLLMINLFVNQGSISLDAMFGIAGMNADNTSLLFYID